MMLTRTGMLSFIALLLGGNLLAAESFEVQHDHFWRSCNGKLLFSDSSIEYLTDNSDHARVWKYEDIQQLDITPGHISILTYDIRKIALGADRAFNFKVLAGDLSDAFRKELEARLARPLVSSIIPESGGGRYAIPVRHRRFLAGSQGVLELADDYVVYRSLVPKESRVWRYGDLLSFGSSGPYQLRLGALEKTGGEYGAEKNYVFDLKRRLGQEEYDFIWEKINRRAISGVESR